ncbi:MAG: hypothetical protein SGPRY_009895 [Prymnesium sp.]
MSYEADSHKEEKSFECPMKMHLTGLEVKQGRKEIGDVDSYDFKFQCSGIWQSYLGLSFSSEKAKASKECPAGMMAYGWRAYRGFVRRGDRDYYEFELNCKEAGSGGIEAVRKTPGLREIGLPQNVFIWSAKDVATWLKALGLGEYAPAFESNKLQALGLGEWQELVMKHRVQGDVMFSLKEETLAEMGMSRIGDRLFLVDCLQALYEELTAWKKHKDDKIKAAVPALGGPGSSSDAQYKAAMLLAQQQAQARAQAQKGSGGSVGGRSPTPALKKLLAQGYSMQEVMQLLKSRPELMSKFFQ